MKRARTILTASAALAAALAGGCSSNPSFASNDADFYYNADGVSGSRHTVGVGDSLGAALWGHDITLAKAHQFGETEYASVGLGYGIND